MPLLRSGLQKNVVYATNILPLRGKLIHYKEHPSFQLSLHVNFVSGEGESGYTKITGSDGVMYISENKVTVKRRKMPKACNDSYFQDKIIRWDADKMKLI